MPGLLRRLAAPVAARLLRGLTGLPEASLASQVSSGSASALANRIPRPTPTLARSGFLLHTPELLNHFSSVMDCLPTGSFDLVVCRDAEGGSEASTAAARWKAKVVNARDVLSSGQRYDWLVSNHPTMLGDPSIVKRLADVHVRFMYSAGKAAWNLSSWNDVYDVILCYGPYHAAELAQRTHAVIVQMGYPRLDAFFNDKTPREELLRRFDCDPRKQTIVWLPTWKALSSVGRFDEEVSALTRTYNVIAKIHPLMPGDEPDKVAALARHSFTHLINDASDNLPLYKLADFMLFDYGGPPFAGVYTDKRMLLLNAPNAGADSLTGEDSPDVLLRRTIANVDAGCGDLSRLLADANVWQEQKAQRRALRQQYFAPYYGFSSRVAALALANVRNILASADA